MIPILIGASSALAREGNERPTVVPAMAALEIKSRLFIILLSQGRLPSIFIFTCPQLHRIRIIFNSAVLSVAMQRPACTVGNIRQVTKQHTPVTIAIDGNRNLTCFDAFEKVSEMIFVHVESGTCLRNDYVGGRMRA